MQTIRTSKELLLQIHKNHVVVPIDANTTLQVIDSLTKEQIQLPFTWKELTNCYLLSITDTVFHLDRTQTLQLLNHRGIILYSSILTVLIDSTNVQ